MLFLALGSGITLLATFGHQYYQALPKLAGRIVVTTVGRSEDPRFTSEPVKAVSMFICLANPKDVPVTVVDYVLEAKSRNGWNRLLTVYNHMENFQLEFPTSPFGKNMVLRFPSDTNFLTFDMTQPIQRSQPRCGLLVFLAPKSLGDTSFEDFRLTVCDAFGGKHMIKVDKSVKQDPTVLLRLAPGISIEKSTPE